MRVFVGLATEVREMPGRGAAGTKDVLAVPSASGDEAEHTPANRTGSILLVGTPGLFPSKRSLWFIAAPHTRQDPSSPGSKLLAHTQ